MGNNENEDLGEDGFPYSINYEKILTQKGMLPITKLLVTELQKNPYMTPGDFFKDLPDSTLSELQAVADDNESKHFEELILITEMLTQAEGLASMSFEEMNRRTSQFIMYLTLESLKRKGLIIVHYENLSFGDDYGDKMIAERVKE